MSQALKALIQFQVDRKDLASLKGMNEELDALRDNFRSFAKDLTYVPPAAEQASDALEDLGEDVEESGEKVERAGKRFRDFSADVSDSMDSLGQIASKFNEIGGGIIGKLTEMSTTYTQSMGVTEAASVRLLRANYELERSQRSLGRSAASALLPYQQRMAEMMNMLSQFIARNPGLFEAGVNVASILLAAQAAISSVSAVKGALNTVNSVMAAGRAAGGVGRAAGAAVGVGSAAIAIGIGANIGRGIVNGLGGVLEMINEQTGKNTTIMGADADYLQQYTLRDTLATATQAYVTYILLINKALDALAVTVLDTADAVVEFWNSLTGDAAKGVSKGIAAVRSGFASGENTARLEELLTGMLAPALYGGQEALLGNGGQAPSDRPTEYEFTEADLNEYLSYLDGRQRAEEDFQYQQSEAARQFRREQEVAEEEYNYSQAQGLEAYNYEREMAQKEHNRSLADAQREFDWSSYTQAEEYHYSLLEAERQFNRDRMLAQRDHDYSRFRAQEDYDYEEVQRVIQFNRDRRRAEEEHRRGLVEAASMLDAKAVLEQSRSFQIERRRAAQDYAIETKERQKQFNRQQWLDQREFERQQALNLEQYEYQLSEQERQYNRQRELALRDYNRQISEQQRQFRVQEDLAKVAYDRQLELEARQFKRQQDLALINYNYQIAQQQIAYDRQLALDEYYQRLALQRRMALYTQEGTMMEEYFNLLRGNMRDFIAGAASDPSLTRQYPGTDSTPPTIVTVAPGSLGTRTGSGGAYVSSTGGTSKGSSSRGASGVSGTSMVTYLGPGGYTSDDRLYVHDQGEFLLSQRTTAALERMMGGTLTQEKVLSAISYGDFFASMTVNAGGAGGFDLRRILEPLVNQQMRSFFMAYAQGNRV